MRKFMAIPFLLAVVLAGQSCGDRSGKTRVIAHRGYWNTEGSAQNSIAALRKAAEIGVYGAEFDVNVTSDGIPIVNHDNHISGNVIEANPYSVFRDVVLSNGEKLPTLEQYLEEGKKHPKLKLILEIKSASTPEFESEATGIIMDMVDRMGVKDQVEYIAFSPHIVKEIVKADPKATVAYLSGDIAPSELKKMGVPGLDYHFSIMDANPGWFEEAKNEGVSINIWTVNEAEDMRRMISMGADFITTDQPELLQEILAEK